MRDRKSPFSFGSACGFYNCIDYRIDHYQISQTDRDGCVVQICAKQIQDGGRPPS